MWKLRAVRGEARPAEIEISDGLTLGRGRRNSVQIRSELASRRHARIAYQEDGDRIEILDLNSANGVEVNGKKIRRMVVAEEDVLRVGGAEFRLVQVADTDSRRSTRSPSSVGSDTQVRVEGSVRGSTSDSTPDVRGWLSDSGLGGAPLERLAAGVLQGLRADGVVVLVRLTRAGEYRIVVEQPPRREGETLPVSRALLARAEVAGEALLLSAAGPEISARESVAARAAGSALCAPIEQSGEVLGALYAERGPAKPPFSQRDLDLIASIAIAAGDEVSETLAAVRTRDEEVALLLQEDNSSPLLVCASPAYLAVLDVVERVADLATTVLLQGERATGKKTLARAIHDGSTRRDLPFLQVPCPELPPGREAALLFGERVDSGNRPGLLTDAGEGTLCLADVDRLSADAQHLVREALEKRRFVSLGTATPRTVRCRIIATSCTPLQPLVDAGKFDERLHALLSLVVVRVPALRDRREDIPLLARHFATQHGVRLRSATARLTEQAVELLQQYAFPGNVGELSNVVESMVLIADDVELACDAMPAQVLADAQGESPRDYSLAEAERAAVLRALRATGGRKGKAADLLGISWPTLTKKVRKYRLDDA